MKKLVKAALATAMVMGFSSYANAVGSNTGTVNFIGTIEDSPCSIVVGDEHQTINLGHIGTGSLAGGKSSTAVPFKIRMEHCVFTTETKMSTVPAYKPMIKCFRQTCVAMHRTSLASRVPMRKSP